MPKIADFVRYLEGTTETQAMIAWSQVSKAIETIGAYHSVIFENPIITEVIVHMGGWIKLCQSKTHELPFVAKEFEKLYGHYATRTRSFVPFVPSVPSVPSVLLASSGHNTNTDKERVDFSEQACLSPLCGIFEHENSLQGYDSPPPIVIPSDKQSKPMSIPSGPKILAAEGIAEAEETKKTEKTKIKAGKKSETGITSERGVIHER